MYRRYWLLRFWKGLSSFFPSVDSSPPEILRIIFVLLNNKIILQSSKRKLCWRRRSREWREWWRWFPGRTGRVTRVVAVVACLGSEGWWCRREVVSQFEVRVWVTEGVSLTAGVTHLPHIWSKVAARIVARTSRVVTYSYTILILWRQVSWKILHLSYIQNC